MYLNNGNSIKIEFLAENTFNQTKTQFVIYVTFDERNPQAVTQF